MRGLLSRPAAISKSPRDNSTGSIETRVESLLKWEKRLASENLNMACLPLGGTMMLMDGRTSTSLMIFMELITFTEIKEMALSKMSPLELCPTLLGFQWGQMLPI